MEWEQSRRSDNIEDVRGQGGYDGGGGGGGLVVGGGGLGIGAIIILALIGYATGIDPRVLIGGAEQVANHGQQYGNDDTDQRPQQQARTQPSDGSGDQAQVAPKDQMRDFVAAVLGETEDVWSQVLPAQKGVQYQDPKLVLYSGVTRSGCGQAQSAMGPFYCPTDRKVYLDMSFFNDMRRKLGGGGDFAYAYVIAHEVGHHVQNLLGILPKVHEAMEQSDPTQANQLSQRLELQADCFAGVWAANADQKFHILQQGDVDKALNTAEAIGDDRLQKASRGYAVPDSFTHGTSAERKQWLTTGLKTGKVDACNTFRQ